MPPTRPNSLRHLAGLLSFALWPSLTFAQTPPASPSSVYLRQGTSQDRVQRGDAEPPEILLLGYSIFWEDALTAVAAAVGSEVPMLIVASAAEQAAAKAWLKTRRPWGDSVTLLPTAVDTPWVRDYGPLQVYSDALGWSWLDTRYDARRPADDAVPTWLGRSLAAPVEHMSEHLDGGALISNGRGLCVTTLGGLSSTCMDTETTQELMLQLGCDGLAVVLPLVGDKAGHVDMLAQFLGPDVVAVASADPQANPADAARLDEAVATIQATAEGLGRPVRVVRLPLHRDANGIYTTYTNGLRLRGRYLMPSFASAPPGLERVAMARLEEVVGAGHVIPIRADAIAASGGALHCIGLGLARPAAVPPDDTLSAFLAGNHERYVAAIGRARVWLDAVDVDPVALRKSGIKGKKKLVEILDTYRRLYTVASAEVRLPLMRRLKAIAAMTESPAYHDMQTISDREFKQDATSYLRAAYLLDKSGLDTTRYRREIAAITGRLNGHMSQRGPHQRMAFGVYYKYFGLTEPFDLESGFSLGVIAQRYPVERYRQPSDAYDLTHEIFVPYDYGERLDAEPFTPDERVYLRRVLGTVASFYLVKQDPDLLAELVSCIRYLGMTDLPVYTEAIDALLRWQRDNGAWGNYEHMRERWGRLVDQGWYLHTTAVVIDALTIAFAWPERPYRPAAAQEIKP